MNRTIIYSQEQGRTFDYLMQYRDVIKGYSHLARMILGINTNLLFGFSAAQTPVASMNVVIGEGQVWQWKETDASPFGALEGDSQYIWQGGWSGEQTKLLSTSQLSSGQSQWVLLQCKFDQVDEIRAGDPTNGILPYHNSQNPLQPLQGPGGNGQAQPTARMHKAKIEALYGTPATTGSEVAPAASAGFIPMYLIKLTFGQTYIETGAILKAGDAAFAGYATEAPFFNGMLQSHHEGGAFGQAPKIVLTNAKEVSGTLPMGNLPASSTDGIISAFRSGTADPNASVAGHVNDAYFRTTTSTLYYCTETGIAGAAVWTPLNLVTVSKVSSFPATLTLSQGTVILVLSSADVTTTMPAADRQRRILLKAIGTSGPTTYKATITAAGSDKFVINGVEVSTFEMLNDDSYEFVTSGDGKWYIG